SVVGSITLHEAGVWVVRAIGVGGASGELSGLRRRLRATRAADGDAYALVHVVGMHERLVLHREQGVERVTSLKAGAEPGARPARAVLGELAERARAQAAR